MALVELDIHPPTGQGMPDTARTVRIMVNPDYVVMIAPQEVPSVIAGAVKTVSVLSIAHGGAVITPHDPKSLAAMLGLDRLTH